jgi:hypothetical protein
MRGQSGTVMVAGDSAVLFRLNKQKVNARNSTETELIAVDNKVAYDTMNKKLCLNKDIT